MRNVKFMQFSHQLSLKHINGSKSTSIARHIKEKLRKIKENVRITCKKTRVAEKEINILAATKNRTTQEITAIIQAGIRIIGENTVQEAQEKFAEHISQKGKFELHMIGHLQKNKVSKAVALFDCIQSVDTLKLAEKINEAARKLGKIQRIFIQVNISRDANKFGFKAHETKNILFHISPLKNIKVEGLMTIGRQTQNIDEQRTYFHTMKTLFDQLSVYYPLKHLSMGMGEDYLIAIEEGATIVRIGRALFE